LVTLAHFSIHAAMNVPKRIHDPRILSEPEMRMTMICGSSKSRSFNGLAHVSKLL